MEGLIHRIKARWGLARVAWWMPSAVVSRWPGWRTTVAGHESENAAIAAMERDHARGAIDTYVWSRGGPIREA